MARHHHVSTMSRPLDSHARAIKNAALVNVQTAYRMKHVAGPTAYNKACGSSENKGFETQEISVVHIHIFCVQ